MWGKRVASRAGGAHAAQRTAMRDIHATVVARRVCNGLHASVSEGPSGVERAMHRMPKRSSIPNPITFLKSLLTCNTFEIKEIGHQVGLAIDQRFATSTAMPASRAGRSGWGGNDAGARSSAAG